MSISTINSGEARMRWRDLLDQVLAEKGDILIERNGKKVAAMIPAGDYEQIRDMLDELRSAREAAAAYAEWKLHPSVARPWEDVEAELDKPG